MIGGSLMACSEVPFERLGSVLAAAGVTLPACGFLPTTTLVEDLALDSFDLLRMAVVLTAFFPAEYDAWDEIEASLGELVTLGDVHSLINAELRRSHR